MGIDHTGSFIKVNSSSSKTKKKRLEYVPKVSRSARHVDKFTDSQIGVLTKLKCFSEIKSRKCATEVAMNGETYR